MRPDKPGNASTETWCTRCGSQHVASSACPAVQVTGPEKPRWRVAVETQGGIRGYGVLVARADQRWRARIVTFPNILWMVPGGGDTVKFFARTEEETIRKAVDFVRQHCIQRGHLMRDEVDFVSPSKDFVAVGVPKKSAVAPKVESPIVPAPASGPSAPRYTRRLPVWFGRSKPTVLGYTGNLSATGLFVATEKLVGEGELLGLSLELEHCKVPLRGSVAWSRLQNEPGRELGMGLHLYNPPPIYVSYVQALA